MWGSSLVNGILVSHEAHKHDLEAFYALIQLITLSCLAGHFVIGSGSFFFFFILVTKLLASI